VVDLVFEVIDSGAEEFVRSLCFGILGIKMLEITGEDE
jgi:hypothetical protein